MTEDEFRNGKDINPKDAVGERKAPMSVVPAPVMLEVGLAMMEGARKYGRHNYRITPIQASAYYDAVMRHMMVWWEGEDLDADSGLNHITKAISTLVVLRDAMMNYTFIDDRPPAVMTKRWLEAFNIRASALVDDHPDCAEIHTQITKIQDELAKLAESNNGNS